MKDLNHCVEKYKEQLKIGDIPEAYVGLVKYMTRLGTDLSNKLSEYYSFGSLFQGYMDYTYFYYANGFLKDRKLKMGLVLNHNRMQFEIWLLGQTKPIQEKYWAHFKATKWNKDRDAKPQYAILETAIITKPNFNDLDELTLLIEKSILAITNEIIQDIKISKIL